MAERRIGVAMDFSASSKKALRWAADNLVRKGDTLVLLHVRHHGREEAKNVLWSHTGSRAHGAAGEAALRHAGGPRGVRHAQRPGTAEGALRGGEDVLGRPEGEGVRRGGGAQPPVARHGQPRPRPDPEDSAGKCDELRAVECIMPCDRRQVKVVSVLRSLQEYQSATGTWAKPKE
ncbi:hypothetical protein SEVIR_5G387401v4 [Setaria viridis]